MVMMISGLCDSRQKCSIDAVKDEDSKSRPCLVGIAVRKEQKAAVNTAKFGAHFTQIYSTVSPYGVVRFISTCMAELASH